MGLAIYIMTGIMIHLIVGNQPRGWQEIIWRTLAIVGWPVTLSCLIACIMVKKNG